jgi:hypothetical protein
MPTTLIRLNSDHLLLRSRDGPMLKTMPSTFRWVSLQLLPHPAVAASGSSLSARRGFSRGLLAYFGFGVA